MAHSNVRSMLSDAVHDAHRGTGKWASYVDHTGDGETGDCIYNCDGDMKSAPYEVSTVGGKSTVNLDTAKAKKVQPLTTYAEQADDDDHYAAMEESMKTANLYQGGLPLYERFISKAERDKADESDFAGKGKSFPILKPGDVQAAVHAMGRAGSSNLGMSALKARIIAIAKKKGWTSELPKSWQGTDATEARRETIPVSRETGTLVLTESVGCEFLAEIPLSEAAVRTSYPVKLISPGTGSSAHYPADVLERDGPKLFKKGTLMFWNHPTARESAERPEGDLNNLAAILTQDAQYKHDGPKGPGIYSEAMPMAHYAEKVAAIAPHAGLSIRAGGSGDGSKINGKPVLKSIDYVESVDFVTKAGRGGMILTEAAQYAGILPNGSEEEMTLQEAKELVAREVKTATEPFILSEAREQAKKHGKEILESVSWPKSAKKFVVKQCLDHLPMKEGKLDLDEFRKRVVAKSQELGPVLAEAAGAGRVTGMGPSSPFAQPLTEAQREEQRLAEKRERKAGKALQEGAENVFARLMGGNREAAAKAAEGRIN